MTIKVELCGTTYFVYNVRDKAEGRSLAMIVEQRRRVGNKSTRIDAYKYMDTDNVYYIKQRLNSDIEIRTREWLYEKGWTYWRN